ncbi:MAG: hypothetical protein JHC84_14995 [Solirubrobacteraceae bacterium]|nr:hypothetical protein [Solirubrobacteraceae bacterium]
MRRTALITAALAAALAPAASAVADPGDPITTWVPDGQVRAVALQGSTAYLGGDFTSIAPFTGGSVSLSRTSDQPRPGWPDVAGTVRAAEPDGAGGWYLGGAFTAVGGVPRENLAHVRADGTVDPTWAPTANSTVSTIVRHAGHVYVGGGFSRISEITHQAIAQLDATTGAPTALPLNINTGHVYSLAIGGTAQDPVLYAGGNFAHVNGQVRLNAAAWSLPSGQVTAWNPGVGGTVFALATGHGRVYLGGTYNLINGSKPNLALSAVDPVTGTLVTTWRPNFVGGANVYTLDVQGDVVYAGGAFSEANGNFPTQALRSGAAAFSQDSAVLTAWNPDLDGPVDVLDAAGAAVYVGGRFTEVRDTARPNAAAVDATTGVPLGWNPKPRGGVKAIVVEGDEILLGGAFETAGGVDRVHLGAIDLATGRPTAFRADTDSGVYALAAGTDSIWVGGLFTKVRGTTRLRLAAVDPGTGALRPFSQEIDGAVQALAVSGRTVYAGGGFTAVGTTPRGRVAAFDAAPGATGLLLPFAPNANEPVTSLALGHGRVYLGGSFTTLAGGTMPRRGLAAVDPTTGTPTAFDARLNEAVDDVKVHGGTVIAAGRFDAVGATPRMGLAVLDAATAAPTAFNARLNSSAASVAVGDGQVIAGGYFSRSGEERRRSLGAFDLTSGLVRPWALKTVSLADHPFESLAARDGEWLVAGGGFLLPEGAVRTARFAAFRLPPVADAVAQDGSGGASGSGGVNSGRGPEQSRDRTAPRITRLIASPTRFRVGALPKRGTRLSLTLSEPARVTFEVLAATKGRKAGKRCVRASRANRRARPCQLLRQRIRFTRQLPGGASRLAFTGRAGTKAVGVGAHVLRATPTDAAGNAGPARTLRIHVTR